ncbi:MAG: YceI family protein [Pseudomonadota bacterium]
MKYAYSAAAAALVLSISAPAVAQDEYALDEIPSGAYDLDKGHAHVYFKISHLGFSTTLGRFNDFDADFTLDAADPAKSKLDVAIDVASIDMNNKKFDEHLLSADFFDAENHGEMTFVATGIERTGDKTAKLTGDFTMLGETKPLTLDVELNKAAPNPFSKAPTVGFSARGMLDRTEWGMDKYAPAVGASVDLIIEAEFNKAE